MGSLRKETCKDKAFYVFSQPYTGLLTSCHGPWSVVGSSVQGAVLQCNVVVQCRSWCPRICNAVWWRGVVVQYGGTVSWCCVVVLCRSAVSWCSVVVQCRGAVSWCSVVRCMVQCRGAVSSLVPQDPVCNLAVLVQCRGAVCNVTVLVQCRGAVLSLVS